LNPKNWFEPFFGSSDQDQKGRQSRVLVVFSFLLAAVLLYLALRGLDWAVFFATLKQIKYIYLPIILIWSSLSYLIRAMRWRLLVNGTSQIALREVFWANMVGYLGNNLLPARAGELVRAVYLSKRTENSILFVMATCLAERMMDVVALVIFGSIALLNLHITTDALQYAIEVMALVGILGLFALLLLPRFGKTISRIIACQNFLKERQKEKLIQWIGQFMLGLQSLLRAQQMFFFGLLTILIWCMDALNVVFLASILHIQVGFTQAFVLLASLGLSSALPSTPGYVGIYQFVAVTVLEPLGIVRENALTLILVSQILNILLVSLLGGIGLWRFSRVNILNKPDE
jgi:glycosyltransferase 2 family protein